MVLSCFKNFACTVIQLFSTISTTHYAGEQICFPVLVGRHLFLRDSYTCSHVSVTIIASHENPFDCLDSFPVHNPTLFIVCIFHISIRRICSKMFVCFAFGLHHSADFLARVFHIPLIDDMEKRGKIAVLLVCAVNAVIDNNKPHDFSCSLIFPSLLTTPHRIILTKF